MDTYQTNRHRLQQIATQMGLKLNPDDAYVEKVARLMAKNFDAVGEWICPCKQRNQPPIQGHEITCPCQTLAAEMAVSATCQCRLFVPG